MSLVDNGQARLAYQYNQRPKLLALVNALIAEYDAIDGVLADLKTRLSIDESSGVQLDQIGLIVGQQRPAVVVGEDDAFTFAGAGGKGFSSLNRPTEGGQFVGFDTDFQALEPISDADYRRVLKAVVIANYATSSAPAMIAFISEAIDINCALDITPGHVTIRVPRGLLGFESRIIDNALPVSAGVSVDIEIDDELINYGDMSTLANGTNAITQWPEYRP